MPSEATFARYRVSELVSDPGVPVLIYDDDARFDGRVKKLVRQKPVEKPE